MRKALTTKTILLATAQRRGEVASMKWGDVDLDAKQWVIPAEVSKNGKPHVVPLNDFALRMLAAVPRFEGTGDWVFSITRRSPISGFSKALRHIHEQSETSGFRFHDLRRTAASGMARLAVPPHVVGKVLNHTSAINPVTAIYLRWGYDAERREALDKWGEFLDGLT